MRQCFIAREPAISSANGGGGGGARCGQCRKAQAGENAGGPDIPRIGNYEGAWGVVERAKMSCPLVLGNIHRVEPDRMLTMVLP
jgi:hypothetical protein